MVGVADEELAQALYEDDDDKSRMSDPSSEKRKSKRKLDRLKAMQSVSERIETKAHHQHLDMIEKSSGCLS